MVCPGQGHGIQTSYLVRDSGVSVSGRAGIYDRIGSGKTERIPAPLCKANPKGGATRHARITRYFRMRCHSGGKRDGPLPYQHSTCPVSALIGTWLVGWRIVSLNFRQPCGCDGYQLAIDSLPVAHVIMACAEVRHAARIATCWPSGSFRAHPVY